MVPADRSCKAEHRFAGRLVLFRQPTLGCLVEIAFDVAVTGGAAAARTARMTHLPHRGEVAGVNGVADLAFGHAEAMTHRTMRRMRTTSRADHDPLAVADLELPS
jgi:hypothetical protein